MQSGHTLKQKNQTGSTKKIIAELSRNLEFGIISQTKFLDIRRIKSFMSVECNRKYMSVI